MQSIGERLEEARKRRGISVREASEATKIRGDFLLSFENNQFEIGLPEIYVRGFLRNYGTFLKIDSEKIATDYNAALIGESKGARKEPRELFGRMELPERQRTPDSAPAASAGNPAAPAQRRRNDEPAESTFRDREPAGPDLVMYAKIGGAIVAGILALLLIIWLVKAIFSGTSAPATDRDQGASTTQSSSATANQDAITLIALDAVHVTVTQTSDRVELFKGGLARGETKVVPKNGQVSITYTIGKNLQIEKDGKRYKMPSDTLGRTSLP